MTAGPENASPSYALARLWRHASPAVAGVHVAALSGAQVVELLALAHEPGLCSAQLARESTRMRRAAEMDCRRRLLARQGAAFIEDRAGAAALRGAHAS